MRTWIERVRVDRYFGNHLDEWKAMIRDGWDLIVLIAPTQQECVVLACREEAGQEAGGSPPCG